MRLPKTIGMALMTGLALGGCMAHHPGADEEDDDASAELREHHRHHHRGGVTQFIAMSLDTIGADDAQRPAVEKLQTQLEKCMEPTRDVERKLVLTWADGVAAGAIDLKQFDSAVVELNSTAAAAYECSTDGLNALHALLTPAEREVVADKVQAHWEIWREVNDGLEVLGTQRGGRLAELALELELSTEQVDRISKAITTAFTGGTNFESKKAEAHVLGFATAFVFEKFDARAVAPDENSRLSATGARRMALFYETITPLLNPAQRVTLAGDLREHADHAVLSAN
jgi:hypothetical protein